MNRALPALCVALLLSGCGDPAHEMLQEAKLYLTRDIPVGNQQAILFEKLRVVKRPDGKQVLCGTMNWKNGFDVYDGEKGFFFINSQTWGIEGQAQGGMVAAYCAG